METGEVKVHFQLEQDEDEDDWPPVATESIWASRIADELYRLNNVPFFAAEVSFGDVVKTERREEVEWFVAVAEPSANSTLHVFCFDAAKRQEFSDWIKARGWMWEYAFNQQYIAVNVPATTEMEELFSILRRLDEEEEFEYEFSCARYTQ